MRKLTERCDHCMTLLHPPSGELEVDSTAFCPKCKANLRVVVVKHPETGEAVGSWKFTGTFVGGN